MDDMSNKKIIDRLMQVSMVYSRRLKMSNILIPKLYTEEGNNVVTIERGSDASPASLSTVISTIYQTSYNSMVIPGVAIPYFKVQSSTNDDREIVEIPVRRTSPAMMTSGQVTEMAGEGDILLVERARIIHIPRNKVNLIVAAMGLKQIVPSDNN